MKEPNKRNRRISDLIRREVATLIKTSVSDPRLTSMLITEVDLSPDLSNAKIFYTLPDKSKDKEASLALKKAAGFIRHELSSRTELRYTPQIHFQYDDSLDRANRLLSLMDGIETNPNE